MDGAEGPALHQLDQRPFDQFKNRQGLLVAAIERANRLQSQASQRAYEAGQTILEREDQRISQLITALREG